LGAIFLTLASASCVEAPPAAPKNSNIEPSSAAAPASPASCHGPLRLWLVCAFPWIVAAFGVSWYLDHARPVGEELLAGVATRGDCEVWAKSDRRVNVQRCYERSDQRAAWHGTEKPLWGSFRRSCCSRSPPA